MSIIKFYVHVILRSRLPASGDQHLPTTDASDLDYLQYGAVVEKLRAQNNVARVICQQRRCVRDRPLLKSLHWLPVQQRIQYKIAVITQKALSTSILPCIDELLQRQVTTRSLRSTDAPRLSVP